MAGWESSPPPSVTKAPRWGNSTSHGDDVIGGHHGHYGVGVVAAQVYRRQTDAGGRVALAGLATDHLRGLKENVVVGRLIPAGTGLAYHEERKRKRDSETEMAVSAQEIEAALTEMEHQGYSSADEIATLTKRVEELTSSVERLSDAKAKQAN